MSKAPVLALTQGDTVLAQINVEDRDGQPLDLLGYAVTFRCEARDRNGNAIELSEAMTVLSQGVTQLRLEPATTADLEPGRFEFQVRAVGPGGTHTIGGGELVVDRSLFI